MQNTAIDIQEYKYLCLRLKTEFLEDECRQRLESLGFECVQSGGAHRAYAIVGETPDLLELAAADPDVETISLGSPPVGF
jgi:hypothetical protein